MEPVHTSRDRDSDADRDSLFGATDDESTDLSEEHRSSIYSPCRSGNYSSGRSWYQSPEEGLVVGSADLSEFHLDGLDSGDGFVDALDLCLDTDNAESGLGTENFLSASRGDRTSDDAASQDKNAVCCSEDKHPVESFPPVEDQVVGAQRSEEHSDSNDDVEELERHSILKLQDVGSGDLNLLLERKVEALDTDSGGELNLLLESNAEALDSGEELKFLLERKPEAGDRDVDGELKLYSEGGELSLLLEGNVEAANRDSGGESLNLLLERKAEAADRDSGGELNLLERNVEALDSGIHPGPREELESSDPVDSPLGVNETVESEKTGQAETSVELESDVEKLKKEIGDVEKKKCIIRLGSREAEKLLQLRTENRGSIGWSKEHLGPDELSRYVEKLDLRETYIDTVLDMEDVLLDTGESRGNSAGPSRTGSLASSLSVYDGLWKVDSLEVIGARQRRGGASLGERVVGIREHTIYRIRVKSDRHEWEIERRYREFDDLRLQLRQMFGPSSRAQLPSPWEKVEAESRKFFGNTSPDVVEFRSALLQVCLQSAVEAGPPISTAAPLLRFLFPSSKESRQSSLQTQQQQQQNLQLKELGSPRSDPSRSTEGLQDGGGSFGFGRTIRLIVQVQENKLLRQQSLNQRNLCAGCNVPLNATASIVSGFAQSLGWGKPRLCEYTGQLFCPTCHLNEKAILPARVLRDWDFTPRNVSLLAKAYLDSIHDQPMLCVSAVNPLLYSRVPILAYVKEMRSRLSQLMNCIQCPLRGRLQQQLGTRRYLLEHNDFYALRDLADLSKGAFAGLPDLLKAMLEKLVLHVRVRCSICMELGEPCAAGVLCESPSELIFPYEAGIAHRCSLCSAQYHKACFKLIETCRACTKDLETDSDASTSKLGSGIDPVSTPKRGLFSSLLRSSSSLNGEKLGSQRSSAVSAILGSLDL